METMLVNQIQMPIITWNGERVVTFNDVDRVHQRPHGTAKRNFNTNKDRFIEGVDYYTLTANEIRTESLFPLAKRDSSTKILVTESGYLMLVKSFRDDLAWDVQRQLVKTYFNAKEDVSDPRDTEIVELRQQISDLQADMKNFCNYMIDWKQSMDNIESKRSEVKALTYTIEDDILESRKNIIGQSINILLDMTDEFDSRQSALNYLYEKMRRKYGIVWEQEAKEYMYRYDTEKAPNNLVLACLNDQYYSILYAMITDMIGNCKTGKDDVLSLRYSYIDDMVAKFACKIGYDSDCKAGLWRIILKEMDRVKPIKWNYRTTYYKNKTGKKSNAYVSKKEVIAATDSLYKIFKKVMENNINI